MIIEIRQASRWNCLGENGGATTQCQYNNPACIPQASCGVVPGTCNDGMAYADNNNNSCSQERSWWCATPNSGPTKECKVTNPACTQASCGVVAGTCNNGTAYADNNKNLCIETRERWCASPNSGPTVQCQKPNCQ